jgi:hypothetical protein
MYSEMLDINNDNMFNIIKEIENKFKKEEKWNQCLYIWFNTIWGSRP